MNTNNYGCRLQCILILGMSLSSSNKANVIKKCQEVEISFLPKSNYYWNPVRTTIDGNIHGIRTHRWTVEVMIDGE